MKYSTKVEKKIFYPQLKSINETTFRDNNLFNMSTVQDLNQFYKGFLSADFYSTINSRVEVSEYLSNFDAMNDHLFWKILETDNIQLLYNRNPILYNEWDQLLGPLTRSKYDKIHFQRICLNIGDKCPVGYRGDVPNCMDNDKLRDI